jgi:hypothetical protein
MIKNPVNELRVGDIVYFCGKKYRLCKIVYDGWCWLADPVFPEKQLGCSDVYGLYYDEDDAIENTFHRTYVRVTQLRRAHD